MEEMAVQSFPSLKTPINFLASGLLGSSSPDLHVLSTLACAQPAGQSGEGSWKQLSYPHRG